MPISNRLNLYNGFFKIGRCNNLPICLPLSGEHFSRQYGFWRPYLQQVIPHILWSVLHWHTSEVSLYFRPSKAIPLIKPHRDCDMLKERRPESFSWTDAGLNDMSWLGWLGLAIIITVILAVTGIKPTGTRHVAHTSLMWMARLALLAVLVLVGYLAFRTRSGGWRCRTQPDVLSLQWIVIYKWSCRGLVLHSTIGNLNESKGSPHDYLKSEDA